MAMRPFGDYQVDIYLAGMQGVLPKYPADFASLERRAQAAMPADLVNYIQGGCGDEHTQRSNTDAFRHWGLIPRMLVDCSSRDLSIDLLGMKLPSPIFLSPIGVTGLCTQDGHGDLAAARATAATGVPMMVSTLANDPLEQVIAATGDVPALFQFIPRRTSNWPKASFIALRRRDIRGSSSASTAGLRGGARATSTRPISRSCEDISSQTIFPTGAFGRWSAARPWTTCGPWS
jgi:hypothetical protein